MIKSRKMRLAGNVENTREIRNTYKILVVEHEEKRPLRRLGIDGSML
jgi:hypothetical protein